MTAHLTLPSSRAQWLARLHGAFAHRTCQAPPSTSPSVSEWLPEGPEDAVALIPAAVLMPIVTHPHRLTVLLTQRSAHLRDHAGQISFPGGRTEAEDISPTATALREAHEEIGLDTRQINVLGILSDYETRTGFRVTPVVALVSPPLQLQPDPFEVAATFEVPLDFLLDPAHWQRRTLEYRGKARQFWAMIWQDHFIWGATAGMLVHLHRTLFASQPHSLS